MSDIKNSGGFHVGQIVKLKQHNKTYPLNSLLRSRLPKMLKIMSIWEGGNYLGFNNTILGGGWDVARFEPLKRAKKKAKR